MSETPLVVRTFRSMIRTWDIDNYQFILDAIADDGTAWRRYESNEYADGSEWFPHHPLPQPEDVCD